MSKITISLLLISLIAINFVAAIKINTQLEQNINRDRGCYKKSEKEFKEIIKSPQPKDYIKSGDLPLNWDWRNVSGVNYLTIDRNQHIPQYCGSCWSFATTSSLSDRVNIQRGSVWPQFNAAPQQLINCDGGGTCDGGDPAEAMSWIAQNHLVDETCAPYQATNGLACNPRCKTCNPDGTCQQITNYRNITVLETGKVTGAKDIMAEVYARGPVACSIDATNALEAYTSGIFEEFKLVPVPNHIVSIVGWGYSEQAQKSYWIVRNSWGAYYGMTGYFQIVQGDFWNNLGIELDCVWGVPSNPFN